LNDEKIISQPRLGLVKDEMPGLAPGIFISASVSKSAAITRTLQKLKIEFRQMTGAIPA
jgi:hypothetical protein